MFYDDYVYQTGYNGSVSRQCVFDFAKGSFTRTVTVFKCFLYSLKIGSMQFNDAVHT